MSEESDRQQHEDMRMLQDNIAKLTIQVSLLAQATRNLDQTEDRISQLERSKAFALGAIWAVGIVAGVIGGAVSGFISGIIDN